MKSANLSERYEHIQAWARDFALPILAAYEVSVDDKYAGVKSFGKLVQNTDFTQKQDVIQMTEYNSDYWRALVEMSPGNQLIPVTKIMMHIANGEFDYVNPYLKIIHAFSDENTIPTYLLQELEWRMAYFNDDLNSKILKGIEYNDNSQYELAINQYNEILQEYPNSAWANYELYLSTYLSTIEKDTTKILDRTDWDQARIIIYTCNPCMKWM